MTTLRRLVKWPAYAMGGAATLALLYGAALRPWHLRWGSTEEEAAGSLPGDAAVPRPVLQSTRAITIAAPPESVWPWLLQLGQGRGGFYSHTFFQNLIGADIHNIYRIRPELQALRVGDTVWLASPTRFGEQAPHFTVMSLELNRALVLRADVPPDADFAATWTFALVPRSHGRTRLVVRYRAWSEPAWMAPVMGLEPVHFVMERKMLHQLRSLAEQHASERGAPAIHAQDTKSKPSSNLPAMQLGVT
jgi:hypothetical protein